MPDRSTRATLRPAHWLTAACLALASTFAAADQVVPFTASYAADMRKVPVNGEANHTLTRNDDGSWTLNFHAGMFVARLTEESTFRLQDGRIQPQRYRYERRGLGRGRITTAEFDRAAGEVRGEHRGDAFSLPLEEGLLDKVSYQFALQRDLLAGKTEMHYRVVDGDDVEDYSFRVTGEQRVTTRVGQFDAVEVERVRDEGARRQTTLWFAKDWQYLLVRLNQVETDGQHYQIVLKEATIDGETVTGIPVRSN
jgi:hypothetical protein